MIMPSLPVTIPFAVVFAIGLLKYMPSNWMCDPKYFPFPLGEWSGQEMEWSWRH